MPNERGKPKLRLDHLAVWVEDIDKMQISKIPVPFFYKTPVPPQKNQRKSKKFHVHLDEK